MINFAVVTVQFSDAVRTIGAELIQYFRISGFSETMFENEHLTKKFVNSTKESKVVFMNCSDKN